MAKFLHSRVVQDQAIAADGIFTYDLAVNPLSVVYLVLRPLNETSTRANYARPQAIAAAFNRVSILYRGESIVSARGEDLAALNWFRYGMIPWDANPADTDNERRTMILPVFLGRYPWNPKSCFPATKRGELVLELDIDVADTGYDNFRLSVETLELLDAKPSEYEKKVQVTQTMAATGDQDVDLPIGNINRGLLAFGTTAYTGAVPAPTWGSMKVLLDNQEAGYAQTDWEVAQALSMLWGRQPPTVDHLHGFTDAAAGVTQTQQEYQAGRDYTNYAFLDFDPTGDDMFALDTRGKSRFHLRGNVETANAVRVLPIECIKV